MAALGALVACSDGSQPDPPDMGGSGVNGTCPSGLPSSSECASGVPSYERDVAPIIEQRCATCHYPGNRQTGDVFVEYDDIYSERQTVLTRIYSCAMPPSGAPSPTAEERSTLLSWFVCGAPDN